MQCGLVGGAEQGTRRESKGGPHPQTYAHAKHRQTEEHWEHQEGKTLGNLLGYGCGCKNQRFLLKAAAFFSWKQGQ